MQTKPQPPPSFFESLTDAEEAEMIPLSDPLPQDSPRLRILSWNLLAQCLIKRTQFPYVTIIPGQASPIAQKTRSPLLIRALLLHRFDVACLQEVDIGQWESSLHKSLTESGYAAHHFRKVEGKSHGHGLAVVWKHDMFECVASKLVLFDGHELTHPTRENPVTGNIGCIVALKYIGGDPRLTGFGVVVSNHHLFWWPEAKYEKLRQAYVLLSEVEKMRGELGGVQEGSEAWPHVLCGDFNTTPSDALYQVLTSDPPLPKEVVDSLNFKPLTRPTKGDQPTPSDTPAPETPLSDASPCTSTPDSTTVETEAGILFKTLTKEFLITQVQRFGRFTSAYSTYRTPAPKFPHGSGEPLYTSFDEWQGTLDYIMTPREEAGWKMKVDKVLRIPDAAWLEPGLPNLRFPSDHLPILA
ncbi:hypothetical protein HDU98_000280, partial [Podochytrium sp. JEL0797]